MANKPSTIIANAKKLKKNGYVYVYGYKGEVVTVSGVNNLAKLYPSVFTSSIKTMALNKVGKHGIDCSGFVNKCAGTSLGGSAQIKLSAPHTWSVSNMSHIKNGMFVWKEGHIGLVEVDGNGNVWIHEAMGTAYDLRVSKWSDRASHFTAYGEIKGVDYSDAKAYKTTGSTQKKVASTAKKTNSDYAIGNNYTLQANMKIRTSAKNDGVNNQTKYADITTNAKQNSKNVNGYAVLLKGTKVTCASVKTVGTTVWMKIPSGWICAKDSNRVYVK